MTDTGFYVPAEKQPRFAANYYSDGKGRLIIRDDPAKSGYLRKPGLSSGGGGLVGTASDYLRFLLMIANDGEWQGKRLLSAESAERMHTNQLPKGVDWIGFGDEQAHGRRLRPGFLGDGRTRRQESARPQRRVRLGRRGQHALLGLAARSADRRDDGTALAVLTGDGRGAQAGDL